MFVVIIIYYLLRDGSPVELVGLCYSAVSWLASLSEKGQYPFTGVYTTNKKTPGMRYSIGMSLGIRMWECVLGIGMSLD